MSAPMIVFTIVFFLLAGVFFFLAIIWASCISAGRADEHMEAIRRQAEREREIQRLGEIPVLPFDPESLR
jgi:hypothetical protein